MNDKKLFLEKLFNTELVLINSKDVPFNSRPASKLYDYPDTPYSAFEIIGLSVDFEPNLHGLEYLVEKAPYEYDETSSWYLVKSENYLAIFTTKQATPDMPYSHYAEGLYLVDLEDHKTVEEACLTYQLHTGKTAGNLIDRLTQG